MFRRHGYLARISQPATYEPCRPNRPLSVNSAINRSLRKTQTRSQRPPLRNDSRNARPRGRRDPQETRRSSGSSPIGQSNRAAPPLTIPYTTSASEFLYGTSAVKAALQAGRRKCYKLYMYAGDNREAAKEDMVIRKLALKNGVVVDRVKSDRLRLMDKMSEGRPHNGFVLEASPLPKLPVTGLGRVQKPNDPLQVDLDHQSREDQAINGNSNRLHYETSYPRYPFIVFLDGILESGNLGAIVRSAFFLGADAVMTTAHSAPLSAVALKASAGAAELLPLMTVAQPLPFLDTCKARGWKVYAASALSSSKPRSSVSTTTSQLVNPLRHHPCLLMMGSEGEGVRERLLKKGDFDIAIEGPRMGKGGVDSLNVSVAAGLLIVAFLKSTGSKVAIEGVNSDEVGRRSRIF